MQNIYKKIRNLLLCLLVSMMYPIYKYVSAEQDQLLQLINAATVVGLVLLILGVFNNLLLHGDFDITEYIARRAVFRKSTKPYKAFKEDKKEEREGKANYPLLAGVIMLAIAAVLTLRNY